MIETNTLDETVDALFAKIETGLQQGWNSRMTRVDSWDKMLKALSKNNHYSEVIKKAYHFCFVQKAKRSISQQAFFYTLCKNSSLQEILIEWLKENPEVNQAEALGTSLVGAHFGSRTSEQLKNGLNFAKKIIKEFNISEFDSSAVYWRAFHDLDTIGRLKILKEYSLLSKMFSCADSLLKDAI